MVDVWLVGVGGGVWRGREVCVVRGVVWCGVVRRDVVHWVVM